MLLRNYFGGQIRRDGRSLPADPSGLLLHAAIRSSPRDGYFGLVWPLRKSTVWAPGIAVPTVLIDGSPVGRVDPALTTALARAACLLTIGPMSDGLWNQLPPVQLQITADLARRAQLLLLGIRPPRIGDKGDSAPSRVRAWVRYGPPPSRLRRLRASPQAVAPTPMKPPDPLLEH